MNRREQTSSEASDGDVDVDVDGIELEAIPESPIRMRADRDWTDSNGGSMADLPEALADMTPQPERNEVTTSSDLHMVTMTYPPVGIHEAHTILTNQRAGSEAPPMRTRQRKMGVTSAPDIPLDIPPRPEPPTPVLTNWMPNIQQSNIKQSSLRVGEDTVSHRCPCFQPILIPILFMIFKLILKLILILKFIMKLILIL